VLIFIVYLYLTGRRSNAMKDDDRADLLWQPENAAHISGQEGNN